MTRQEYLEGLEKALNDAHVPDAQEILDEYGEHFQMKLQDGFSEEEICARLLSPKEIAAQFEAIGGLRSSKRGSGQVMTAVGLVCADIFTALFMLLSFGVLCVCLGACALSFAGLGLYCALGFDLSWSAILHIPFPGAQFIGIALAALGVLSAVGTVYCWRWLTQLTKAYLRWHNNTWPPKGQPHTLPPLPKFPIIDAKRRRQMRFVTLIALSVFVLSFAAGYISLAAAAGNLEFWHVWQWFV